MVAKLGIRLIKSTLLWLVLLLVLAEFSSKTFAPLSGIAHDKQRPNQLTQEALSYKSASLRSLTKSPDVLVLGSSLPMAAIRYCDNQFIPQTEADNDAVKNHLSVFQAYCRAVYLEKLLTEYAGHQVSVFNFTGAACMPSDASLIFSKAIEDGRKPKLVIIGFGPRDFMDNLVPEIGRTPAFTALTDWPALSGNLPNSLSIDTIRELGLSACLDFYRKRADWSLLLCQLTNNFVRPENQHGLAVKANSGIPSAVVKTTVVKNEDTHVCPTQARYEAWHIEDYKKRYNPPNYLRYEQELERFAHLLDTCKQKEIAVVVVNMPITETNRQLIPKTLLKRYLSDLDSYAQKYGAYYADLSSSTVFSEDDFLDTVHVNPQGGKKVLDELLVLLQQSSQVAHVLDANSVKSIGLTAKKEKAL